MIYPVLYMALGSFTTKDRFLETIFLPIPNTVNLGLFTRAFSAVWDSYLFTLARVIFYLTMNLLTGLMGGYVFSKLRFPGKDRIFLLFLSGLVMPNILIVVPQYLQMARFPFAGGNNILGQGGHGFIWEYPVLFLYGWISPFAIFFTCRSTTIQLSGSFLRAARTTSRANSQ